MQKEQENCLEVMFHLNAQIEPTLVWVGRGSDIEGHLGIWAGAVGSKRSKTPKNNSKSVRWLSVPIAPM